MPESKRKAGDVLVFKEKKEEELGEEKEKKEEEKERERDLKTQINKNIMKKWVGLLLFKKEPLSINAKLLYLTKCSHSCI